MTEVSGILALGRGVSGGQRIFRNIGELFLGSPVASQIPSKIALKTTKYSRYNLMRRPPVRRRTTE